MITIAEIDIDLLDSPEWNPNHMGDIMMERLGESVDNFGFDEPLIVIPNTMHEEEGRYLVLSGNQRLRLWRQERKVDPKKFGQKIPCIIKSSSELDPEDMAQIKRYVFAKNLIVGDIDVEKASQILSDEMHDGISLEALQDEFFLSGPRADAYYKALEDDILPVTPNGEVNQEFLDKTVEDLEKEAASELKPEDATDEIKKDDAKAISADDNAFIPFKRKPATESELDEARKVADQHRAEATVRMLAREIVDSVDNDQLQNGFAFFSWQGQKHFALTVSKKDQEVFEKTAVYFEDKPEGLRPFVLEALTKALSELPENEANK